jgi:4-amino-4-deoxy-L-arabinose transferase-like glycosyltransferase
MTLDPESRTCDDSRTPPAWLLRQAEGAARSPDLRLNRLVVLSLVLDALVVLCGQVGRDLVTMDDLREAEIAREMASEGDFLVPRLAGLPFVEKPPGFQILLVAAFRAVGYPSVFAARLVSAFFALATLAGVFLLGRRAWGPGAGALGAGFLALAPLFARTAHVILLDNALAATFCFALYFLFLAVNHEKPEAKRRAYAAAGFALGLSFLVKGFVGPVLACSGMLAFLIVSRRWSELKSAFHPFPVLAFLLPVSSWLVPFLMTVPQDLALEFLVRNHLGRFTSAYAARVRPWYYHLEMFPLKFGAGSFLVPWAVWSAWRNRRREGGGPALFFLCFSLGPLILLSLSSSQEPVYLLPVFPALCLLVAGGCSEAFRAFPSRWALGLGGAAALTALGAGVAAVGATIYLGGRTAFPAALSGGAIVVGGLGYLLVRLRQQDWPGAVFGAALSGYVALLLFFTGPIAHYEVNRAAWRIPLQRVLNEAGNHPLFLYWPDDERRGACGFYRRRTALETRTPEEFVKRLAGNKMALGLVLSAVPGIPSPIGEAAGALGVVLEERLRVPYYRHSAILLGARPRPEP